MTLDQIQAIANQAARRHGFKACTEIRYDARRRYGAKLVNGKRGHRSKGRYVKTVCVIAVPAAWQEVEYVALGSPEVEITRTRPSQQEWDRFSKFRRLSRFNDFRTCMKLAYGTDPGDSVDKLLDDFIAKGVLIGPDPRTLPKPKARHAKGRGLFPKEDC